MKLTYTVTENDYIQLLSQLISKKDRKPFSMLTLFLLTIGQMGIVAWLCATRVERQNWVYLIVWSLLIAFITVLRRCTVRARAKGTLYRLKSNGQLVEDYWKPHRLEETDDGLRLTFGGTRILCPPGHLGALEENGDLLYIYADGTIFDIIPASAFSSRSKKENVLAALESFRGRPAELPPELAESEEEDVSITLSYEEGGFLKEQVAAYRTLYARYQAVKTSSLLKLGVSIFFVVYTVYQGSRGTIALAAALCLLLNRDHLLAFTPLTGLRIRKELGAWSGCRELVLTAGSTGIRLKSPDTALFVPYSSIGLSEEAKIGRIFSWGRLPAIVIPKALRKTPEGMAFLDQVASGRSLVPKKAE